MDNCLELVVTGRFPHVPLGFRWFLRSVSWFGRVFLEPMRPYRSLQRAALRHVMCLRPLQVDLNAPLLRCGEKAPKP